jgi:hypothetical protein
VNEPESFVTRKGPGFAGWKSKAIDMEFIGVSTTEPLPLGVRPETSGHGALIAIGIFLAYCAGVLSAAWVFELLEKVFGPKDEFEQVVRGLPKTDAPLTRMMLELCSRCQKKHERMTTACVGGKCSYCREVHDLRVRCEAWRAAERKRSRVVIAEENCKNLGLSERDTQRVVERVRRFQEDV